MAKRIRVKSDGYRGPPRRPINSKTVSSQRKWQRVAKAHLRAYPFCVRCLCLGHHNEGGAIVVDHVVPHRGDVNLFWSLENLQTLCVSCHNIAKQKHERQHRAASQWFADLRQLMVEGNHEAFVSSHKEWIPPAVYGKIVDEADNHLWKTREREDASCG